LQAKVLALRLNLLEDEVQANQGLGEEKVLVVAVNEAGLAAS